jgi:hypothetical protein
MSNNMLSSLVQAFQKLQKKLFARNVELPKTSSEVLSLEVKVFVFKPSMHLRVAYMSTFISSNFGIFMD